MTPRMIPIIKPPPTNKTNLGKIFLDLLAGLCKSTPAGSNILGVSELDSFADCAWIWLPTMLKTPEIKALIVVVIIVVRSTII
jgi:hypothetical protein